MYVRFLIKSYLESPDQRALQGGLANTGIPACMDQFVHVLLQEDAEMHEQAVGMCMEYVLENDGRYSD